MENVFTATTIPSLRRFWRKTLEYIRFILPEIAVTAGFVLIMLAIIRRCFFVR